MDSKRSSTALLLVNLGTPDAPTPSAVRRYLAEFLGDPRVVEIPKPIWWLILHGVILWTRPRKSAKAYRSIWTDKGSPLLVLTEELAEAVRKVLQNRGMGDVRVEIAMRYGQPSVKSCLEVLHVAGVNRIIVLPLYPQYAAATTASIFDAVAKTLGGWRHIPALQFFSDYHGNSNYIAAVAASIEAFWARNGRSQMLLLSFHGLPERCRALGDPYHEQCLETARLIVQRLQLADDAWRVVFQSRFGPAAWIKPYCVDVLKALPGEGIKSVDLVCPGFAVDCLETLEEIAIANQELFVQAGGEQYHYIPALNAADDHASALVDLVFSPAPV